ncbi:MAG: type IV pilin protein [Acidiferrobacterales bacterium]
MRHNKDTGFTLIELMITLVVFSILVAIAYPSYIQWVTKSRRSDGEIALTQLAAQEEKYFTECNSYTTNIATSGAQSCPTGGGATGNLVWPSSSPDNYYTLTAGAGPTGTITSSYALTATATGVQATNDPSCQKFTLDSTGMKGSSPSGITICWQQ